MQKNFSLKIEESVLEQIKDFSEKHKISIADVFKTGADLYMSESERVKELESEIQALKDTLEANVASTDYGFIPELNKAIGNLIKRLHKCRSGSHAHFARSINRWATNTIHTSLTSPDMNRAPIADPPQE
jgi:cob(I)alamin adenosyltransferase